MSNFLEHGHLPGLQIYNVNGTDPSQSYDFKLSQFAIEGRQLKATDSQNCTPATINGEFDFLVDRFARDFSDWTTPVLHDYSPTIAHNEELKTREQLALNSNDNCNNSKDLKGIVSKLFSYTSTLEKDNYQYLEEFQYTVGCSRFLNEKRRLDMFVDEQSVNSAIFTAINDPNTDITSFASTLGQCQKKESSSYLLKKSLDYNKIAILSFKILYSLKLHKYKHKLSGTLKQKVVIIVLLCFYLSLKQELFHVQYLKYKTLNTLNEVLFSLYQLNSLIDKFLRAYKELTSLRPISSISCEPLATNKDAAQIEKLLISVLNVKSIALINNIQKIMVYVNEKELSKYNNIYKITYDQVLVSVQVVPNNILDSFANLEILQKFYMSCLISANLSLMNSYNNSMSSGPLKIIFGNNAMERRHVCQSKLLTQILISMKSIQQTTQFLIQTMIQNIHLLSASVEVGTSDLDSKVNTDADFTDILSKHDVQKKDMILKLKQLESKIFDMNFESSSQEENELISSDLYSLFKKWKEISTDQSAVKTNNLPKIQSLKKRFSINVYNTPQADRKKSLNRKVSIIDVPNSMSEDLEFLEDNVSLNYSLDSFANSMQSDFNLDNEGAAQSLKFTKNKRLQQYFKNLPDKELTEKLNEKLSELALENKMEVERVRTKKSFELLKHDEVATQQARIESSRSSSCRSTSNNKYLSEECIPVLYEMQRLFEK